MRTLQVLSIFAAALIASAGFPAAQDKGMGDQPPAKQSAPSESTDAPGHDAQSGKPETAEMPKPDTQKITLTEDQAKNWIDKPVFSSDDQELGEVAAFKRSVDNTVLEMHADIGGLLGIGETRVSVTPAQFKLQNDRVVLTLTKEQANALPKVKN
jgi:PRC-barrel domain